MVREDNGTGKLVRVVYHKRLFYDLHNLETQITKLRVYYDFHNLETTISIIWKLRLRKIEH